MKTDISFYEEGTFFWPVWQGEIVTNITTGVQGFVIDQPDGSTLTIRPLSWITTVLSWNPCNDWRLVAGCPE